MTVFISVHMVPCSIHTNKYILQTYSLLHALQEECQSYKLLPLLLLLHQDQPQFSLEDMKWDTSLLTTGVQRKVLVPPSPSSSSTSSCCHTVISAITSTTTTTTTLNSLITIINTATITKQQRNYYRSTGYVEITLKTTSSGKDG